MTQNTITLNGEQIPDTLPQRNQSAGRWAWFFFATNIFAIVALVVILFSVLNNVFGYVKYQLAVEPSTLSVKPYEQLTTAELGTILGEKVARQRLRAIFVNQFYPTSLAPEQRPDAPVSQIFAGKSYPAELADKTLRTLEPVDIGVLMGANLSDAELRQIVNDEIVKFQVLQSWSFLESVLNRPAIDASVAATEGAKLQFYSWLSVSFLGNPQTSDYSTTGLRTALLGSIWIIIITLLAALPLGIGAAIYLEEYARPTRLNKLIETNIRNLAGVPSIIYGMLGLAVFVRALESITNGRTVLSAGLTMSLLILPVIIINAQEAIRAVPRSIREASYGVGATRWQTTWRSVLPVAIPGILTGLILSMARAIGETAPLIVVGASTAISIDPSSPFSKFTVVPIQIFEWTAQPEAEYRNVAAAAIIVLLALLLSLNASAIFLRQRIARSIRA
jgi:phosphate transport system permease protein